MCFLWGEFWNYVDNNKILQSWDKSKFWNKSNLTDFENGEWTRLPTQNRNASGQQRIKEPHPINQPTSGRQHPFQTNQIWKPADMQTNWLVCWRTKNEFRRTNSLRKIWPIRKKTTTNIEGRELPRRSADAVTPEAVER
jgi:hypothetical protein